MMRWIEGFVAILALASCCLTASQQYWIIEQREDIVALQRLAKDATEYTYRMETRIMRARISEEERRLWREGVDEIEKRAKTEKIKPRPKIVRWGK